MSLFSRRNQRLPDYYTYTISETARRRIFFSLESHLESMQGNLSMKRMLTEVEAKLLSAYGGFQVPAYRAARVSENDVIQHFMTCPDEEVLDFLVMCFETFGHLGGQPAVVLINQIFSEENIGFELTDYSEIETDQPRRLLGGFLTKGQPIKIVLPKAVRKDEKTLHAETVKPCLGVLSDPRFEIANRELMAAFSEHGKGRFGDAITDAGAAFESVLKVICAAKSWTYDKDKDTCAPLLGICQSNNLFLSFYRTVLETTATVRNKLGDAHGKGPSEHLPPNKEYSEHMLYMVCNNINLLISLANL